MIASTDLGRLSDLPFIKVVITFGTKSTTILTCTKSLLAFLIIILTNVINIVNYTIL